METALLWRKRWNFHSNASSSAPAMENRLEIKAEPTTAESSGSLKMLIQQAGDNYRQAQDALRKGEWARYGEEMQKLESTLKEMKEKTP